MQLTLGWEPEGVLPASSLDTSVQGTVGRRVGWKGSFWSHAALQLLATTLALPLSLSLATLLVWNCHLLSQNKTTIEHHEGVAAKLNCLISMCCPEKYSSTALVSPGKTL